MADPVLASMVHALGMETARHYTVAAPKIQAYRDSWLKLAPFRDGPINPKRTEVSDSEAMTNRSKPKQRTSAPTGLASADCSRT